MTTLTLKIEPVLKKEAKRFASKLGVSLSGLIKMLLKDTMQRGRIDIDTKPRYHSRPEPGDLRFSNWDDAIAYFEKEFKKNKRPKNGNSISQEF